MTAEPRRSSGGWTSDHDPVRRRGPERPRAQHDERTAGPERPRAQHDERISGPERPRAQYDERIGERWRLRSDRVLIGATLVEAVLRIDAGCVVGIDRRDDAGWRSGDGGTAVGGGDGPLVDVGRAVVAPGWIDTQCNGAFGIDLVREPERVWDLAARLPGAGVTSFLPTLPTHDPTIGARRRLLRALRDGPADDRPRARPLGAHLEGPWLAPGRAGIHPVDHLCRVDPDDLTAIVSEAEVVSMVTLAPEVGGALSAIEELVAHGVVVALGHSAPSPEVFARATAAGARHVTHLWNAMSGIHHRELGLAALALDSDGITVGLICDGVHVAPEVVRITWALARDRVVVISDAIAAAGQPAAPHPDGADDELRFPDRPAVLAGSRDLLNVGLRRLREWTGAPLADVLAAASSTPARVLGRDDVGRIAPGRRADLVIVDDDLSVEATVLGGRWWPGPPS